MNRTEFERDQLVTAAAFALDLLENLTAEEFSLGGDREARKMLAEALYVCGALDAERKWEYLRTEAK